VHVKSKFWGKSLEALPQGLNHVRLKTAKGVQHFSWQKVTTCVSNLILGTLTIDHYGEMEINNHTTGDKCVVSFKANQGGWFGGSEGEAGKLVGTITNIKSAMKYELNGNWQTHLTLHPISTKRFKSPVVIWQANPRPPMNEKNFHFGLISLLLNDINAELKAKLPPTDSRLRPDQRAMEQGQWDEADKQKTMLETLQRQKRRQYVQEYEESGVPFGPAKRGLDFGEKWWQPRWFYRHRDEHGESWIYNGQYWECRESKWPDHVVSIYD
jgi:hypothetical protein